MTQLSALRFEVRHPNVALERRRIEVARKLNADVRGQRRLAYESVVQRDLNTLLGIVFVSALLVIIVNFVVDLIYARLDPRIVAEA